MVLEKGHREGQSPKIWGGERETEQRLQLEVEEEDGEEEEEKVVVNGTL